jgi:hypothetical protein
VRPGETMARTLLVAVLGVLLVVVLSTDWIGAVAR